MEHTCSLFIINFECREIGTKEQIKIHGTLYSYYSPRIFMEFHIFINIITEIKFHVVYFLYFCIFCTFHSFL